MGPIEGTMEGIGSEIDPSDSDVRYLLGPLGMFGPMAGTSWTHNYSKQS